MLTQKSLTNGRASPPPRSHPQSSAAHPPPDPAANCKSQTPNPGRKSRPPASPSASSTPHPPPSPAPTAATPTSTPPGRRATSRGRASAAPGSALPGTARSRAGTLLNRLRTPGAASGNDAGPGTEFRLGISISDPHSFRRSGSASAAVAQSATCQTGDGPFLMTPHRPHIHFWGGQPQNVTSPRQPRPHFSNSNLLRRFESAKDKTKRLQWHFCLEWPHGTSEPMILSFCNTTSREVTNMARTPIHLGEILADGFPHGTEHNRLGCTGISDRSIRHLSGVPFPV